MRLRKSKQYEKQLFRRKRTWEVLLCPGRDPIHLTMFPSPDSPDLQGLWGSPQIPSAETKTHYFLPLANGGGGGEHGVVVRISS